MVIDDQISNGQIDDTQLWSERFKPKDIKEIIGNTG